MLLIFGFLVLLPLLFLCVSFIVALAFVLFFFFFVGLFFGFVSSFIGVLSWCCVCARAVTLLGWDFCGWWGLFFLHLLCMAVIVVSCM